MPNYGFAIDLRKCIGCHACTIACKAEHQIPIGVNRCWVKTVEQGSFPRTQRFFFPVLCNQCDDAPCMRICPTNALYKRRDGIVDLDPAACIGCRACMVACPYDQLFIDPNTHTAEKCNFCANRVEQQLLPACVSVCPTECRIFGDLDDPASEVARIAQLQGVAVRKPEKETIPKVFYIAAEESAIRPEIATRPFIYKEGQVRLRPIGAPEPDPTRPDEARVDYDTPHVQPWGLDMAIYLLTKGIATGGMLTSALLWLLGADVPLTRTVGPAVSLLFLLITTIVLVSDLERPERFYYILTRPNWGSWMVWGTYFLIAQGIVTTMWIAAGWYGATGMLRLLAVPAIAASILTTCYTGFLFAQGLARDLWQGPQSTLDLLAQAIAEGSAMMLLAGFAIGGGAAGLQPVLISALAIHLLIIVIENVVASHAGTRHRELAVAAILRGAFAPIFWGGAIVCVLLAMGSVMLQIAPLAAVLGLAGTFAWEYVWVEAGQSVPLS
jgi:Fe-S-cluster-containing dehydrogenase component/formate-dependent nitrite reductase membrane component NrfD